MKNNFWGEYANMPVSISIHTVPIAINKKEEITLIPVR